MGEEVGTTDAGHRTQWLAELEQALGEAERLTIRLGGSRHAEADMLLAQIRFVRATLSDLWHGVSPEHPDWVDLFRSLAALGDHFA